jgi:hypothetical protein
MMNPNLKTMHTFTVNNIPNLDVCVLAALELFSSTKLPKIKIPFKRPLVVGSGNAIATGRIIFSKSAAIFADESTFEEKLKNIKFDGVILISASGSKHAPIIARKSKRYKKKVILITNNPKAQAGKFADKIYLFPKNREPYTYNTSTYMGPIFGYTKEDPQKIIQFIKAKVDKVKLPNFRKYKRYYLIIPGEFEGIIRLLNVKFMELFGRNIARDIETFEFVPHATTVVPGKDELFISFGRTNTTWGNQRDRLFIPLPKNAEHAAMMAIGYYIVGKIQKSQPAWFKQNIESYMKKASKIFGRGMSAIVE